jgi:hypothetical protein
MRRTVFALAAAAVLVLALCGGDDGGDSSGSAEDARGDTDTRAETEAEGGDTNAPSGGNSGSHEAVRFCDEFTQLTQEGPAGDTDPESVVEAMRDLDPPAEIADDFDLTIEGAELQAQMTRGDEPDPDLVADYQENSQAYSEANSHVQDFIANQCGLGAQPPPTESDG